MYERLIEICAEIESDVEVRAVIIRGAGDKAFASGTDIAQFMEVRSAADGLAYEAGLERAVGALEKLNKPTLAAIEGYAVGGGAALALVAICVTAARRRKSRMPQMVSLSPFRVFDLCG